MTTTVTVHLTEAELASAERVYRAWKKWDTSNTDTYLHNEARHHADLVDLLSEADFIPPSHVDDLENE